MLFRFLQIFHIFDKKYDICIQLYVINFVIWHQIKAPLLKIPRHITARFLMVLYLLIALTPLSPLLLQSAHIAHAVTGECSGDCDIDGCSLESRANHICCCRQKKMKKSGMQQVAVSGSCCVPAAQVIVVTGACFPPPAPKVPSSCCATTADNNHDQTAAEKVIETEPKQNDASQTIFKCGTPCGKNKVLALVKLTTDEIIPYDFVAAMPPSILSIHAILSPPPLSSRTIEPPEPPPRFWNIS